MLLNSQQFGDRPAMVGNARFHCGSDPQLSMNAAKVVVRKVQSDSGFEVFELLGKPIRKSRQSPHIHPHREVLALHIAGGDVLRGGLPDSDFGYNLLDRTRGVPPFGAVLPIVPKELYKLSEVHIQPKALGDGAGIMNQSIRRQLHRAGKPFVQVPQERGSCLLRSLPNVERGDKFRLRINGNKNPLIANFIGVSLADVAGFLLNEAPDFINFQIPGPQIAHHGTHQFLAAIASVNKQAKNCISIQPGKTLSRSNGTSFQEALNCFGGGIGPRCESIACKSFVGFAESGTARITAPALNAAFTEVSELLASVVLASYACHGLFSACVEREKPYNVVGSELRLIPRFGLALPPVSADDRA